VLAFFISDIIPGLQADVDDTQGPKALFVEPKGP
jgi:hypothetical protein